MVCLGKGPGRAFRLPSQVPDATITPIPRIAELRAASQASGSGAEAPEEEELFPVCKITASNRQKRRIEG